ncbi:MAG TPA: hypothetical protein VLJ68_11800, partial [Chitinophagaceae bacterium]|nr:hypothetical protein [Chitinophagaceae bacterium]
TPEGRLMYDIERIAGIYFQKDERAVTEKNRDMIEEFRKIQTRTKEEIFTGLYRSKYTFSIVAPQNYKAITDSIQVANQNTAWYRDNNYASIANQVTEYGISYCQYSFSLPRAITELYHLFMMINYPEFFIALGSGEAYYDPVKNQFASQGIVDKIKSIQETWKAKYPLMDFKIQQLRFDNLVNFNISFTTELSHLNMEAK